MRILIVNAHAKAPESQKAFQDLLACIKEVLRTHNGLLEIQDEYIVRTRENLEDFLYDDHTSFSQPGPGKKFDSLDFIIVSGDLHSLPWHPVNIKVLTLLRMCLKVKKCLFAIGFAMQALIYLSASNLDHHVNIINGEGKGGKLGDLGKLQVPPDQIGNQDLFLDNVTGDLYHFSYETNEWAPLCNIGLHHNRTAQEYNTIGKYVIKTPIYRPKKALDNSGNTTLIDENNELKCYIKKIFLKHWLFQNCDTGFIVPCKGRWETHAFNFTNKEKTFEILAESDNGALVIEYPRIIGCKFLVNKRYKETYQLLSNFIVKYADDIICQGKSQNMSILAHVNPQPQGSFRFQAKTPELEVGSARGGQYGPKALQGFKHRKLSELQHTAPEEQGKVFKHSGLASKMKGKFILETNFISGLKVRYDSQNHTPMKEAGKFFTKETIMGKYSVMPKKFQTEDDLSFLDEKKKDSFSRAGERSILRTANGNSRQTRRSNMKGVSMFNGQREMLKNSVDEDASLTKEDVRRWLYPDLDGNHSGFEKKVWVPGNMSQTKSESFNGSKAIRVNTCSPDYKKRGPLPVFNYGSVDTQTVRASDPYKTNYDIMKEHQRKEDEKILGAKKFILSKGPMSVQSIAGTPSSRFGSVMSSKHQGYY